MGIQVDTHFFKWLQTLAIAKQGRRTTDNKIELPEQTSMKIFDGVIIGQLIKQIIKLHPQQNAFDKLDAIKQNSTPAIRLYNWNILTQTLKKLGLAVQYSQKSKILNLDSAPIIKVLDFIYNLYNSEGVEQSQKPLQVDISEVPKKQQKDASNILEFFVISISRNFKLSPQHTLNLFLDNNKYLAHLLVKGVKNSFDPVFALLADISENIDFIVVTLFCTDENQSVNFFLNAIKPALISKDINVSQNCLSIFQAMHQSYILNSMPLDVCRNWLRQQGLNTVFFAIKRHQPLFSRFINIAYLFLDQQVFKSLEPIDKSVLWENDEQKIKFFYDLLSSLPTKGVQQFLNSKQYASWIKFILKLMKKSKQANQIAELITVMGWMWENHEEQFENNQNGLPNAYFAFLKNCSLHQSEIVFTVSIQMMFSMMQILGNKKNNNAPFFYKILVSCFSFSGISDRVNFIAINFKEAIIRIKNLPGNPLVEPLIKNLEKEVSADTVDLCRALIEQNRITEDQIIQIIEVLSGLIFHNISYGMNALSTIFDNLSIMNEEMLGEYLQKNSRNALAHFYSVSMSLKRKYSDLKQDFKRYGSGEQMKKGSNSFTEQMQKHIILGYLVKFIEKCIEQSEETKQMLEPLLFHTYLRIKKQLKKADQAELLLPLMKYYYPAEDQLEAKIQDFQEELKPPIEQKIERQVQIPKIMNRKNRSVMNKSLVLNESSLMTTPKPLDSSVLRPSPYALKDLDKLKQKLENVKMVDDKIEKKRDMIQQKKQLIRSIINQKRLIQFGTKNISDMEYKCIFDWDTAKDDSMNKIHGVPDIRLFNLKYQEQPAYTEDIDSVIKKYRKVWRFLFFKYSSFGAKQMEQFKTQQKINMVEIWKMLKQYNLVILKKQQSHAIVRLINEAMRRKNDLQNLTYLGFEEYIFQMCYYGYNKSKYPHVPPGQKILLMIKTIKQATAERGGNIQLFQNPQQVYFQETQVIREFNRRLKQNSEYILPEGYKKIRMLQLNYNYEIHPVNIQGVSSSYVDVFQVLDEIISGCKELGFRLVQPLTHKTQKTIAKPCLFQNLNEKLKDHKKGYLQPKLSPTTADIKSRQKFAGFKNQFHPHINFSLGIKLGLAGVNIKNRFIADEVAYWVDDMLDAIDKGGVKVQNKGTKKIDNEALKRKRASLQKIKIQHKQNQKKYKNRAVSIRVAAQVNRDKKKQDQKQKRQIRKKQRQIQKDRQQRQMKKKLEQFKQAKAKLQQKKKQQESRRKQEHQKSKKNKQEYKKGVEQYFKKKKQQLEQKQSQMKKIKEQDKKKEIEINQKKQQFAKKLHYSILKKQQFVLQKIEDLKRGYDETWTSQQIQDAFQIFHTPLRYLYELLLKYEKAKISATQSDEISLSTLQFFALKFKLVPFMIQKNTLAKIFKGVGRTSQLHTGIDFNGFNVKSKDLLNNIVQTKKQKQAQYNKFLQKKQSDGNHFSIDEQISPSRVASISPKKQSLTEEYLYNVEGVSRQTVKQMLQFLRLPSDKMGVEQRFRQVMESRNSKPKNILIKQLKSELE